jgi:uncharacterized protein YukJ
MPLPRYGVVVGRAADARPATAPRPHYHLRLTGGGRDFRASVNVHSHEPPSELLFLMRHQFEHPITDALEELAHGYHDLDRRRGGLALDYIRGNLLDFAEMRPLPFDAPGPDNDLNELLERYARKAIRQADRGALVYAFGEPWLDERHPDSVFGFAPASGVHNVHMNQGNAPRFERDDAPFQDGALLFHFPHEGQWAALFLKFQSQAAHTDDETGRALAAFIPRDGRRRPTRRPSPRPEEAPDLTVQIVAAMVNPPGGEPERETVTLLNRTPGTIRLEGWSIKDAEGHRFFLRGWIRPGAARRLYLGRPVRLSNHGGLITLLDPAGVKVHGVSYTARQAAREGETIVFGV